MEWTPVFLTLLLLVGVAQASSYVEGDGVVFDAAVAVTIVLMIAASVQHADATCGAPIVVAKEQAFSSDGERNKIHS
ncbi:hypothetical protein TNIN_200941 [Trichonephila inaurata madagascariensis]|uniref:Uncharacterized protein n=1 Tax=Trichonephila inaurata madagascariensis TaxID=2747483 RepID=A0A8X6MFY2_9ARAC|nr:hypothetical protein TNIN_200941 [Trichonephila inaurata madagascariensis]